MIYRVLILLLVLSSPAATQENLDFNISASDLTELVEKAKPRRASAVVAVVDGCREEATHSGIQWKPSVLGQRVSQALRNRLMEAGQAFRQVDSDAMKERLRADLVAPELLCDALVAAWAAGSLGANVVLVPRLRVEDKALLLGVNAIDIKALKGKPALIRRATVSDTILQFLNAEPPKGEHKSTPDESMPVPKAGKDGITTPTCLRCPNPSFTDEAIAARYTGSLVPRVVVSADGKAAIVQVAKGAPYGLTKVSVEAVRRWEFNPASNAEGKPVAVWVNVEVHFRQYDSPIR